MNRMSLVCENLDNNEGSERLENRGKEEGGKQIFFCGLLFVEETSVEKMGREGGEWERGGLYEENKEREKKITWHGRAIGKMQKKINKSS